MLVRKYNQEDYNKIKEWWIKQDWTPITPNLLPKTGFIVEEYACGFLYKSDSDFAWLEFIISNPDSDKELRSEALDLIIKELINEAKISGYKAILTSVKHPALISRYNKFGFITADVQMTNMILGVY